MRLLFDPSPDTLPPWYTAGKNTPWKFTRRVHQGLHPFGHKLSQNVAHKCGNCAHCRATPNTARRYYKCDISALSRGPGTDLRKKWRGCEHWEPIQEEA